MPRRPPGEVRLDDTERALVAVHRAFRAYVLERTAFDPTLDKPRPDEMIALRIDADGSGHVVITPVRPRSGKRGADRVVVSWWDMATAANNIDEARNELELARIKREADRPRGFRGDPRKGRTREASVAARRVEVAAWLARKAG